MSLSKPNSWRIDTFMSGRPATSCVAAVMSAPSDRPVSLERCADSQVLNLADAPRAAKAVDPAKLALFQIGIERALRNVRLLRPLNESRLTSSSYRPG